MNTRKLLFALATASVLALMAGWSVWRSGQAQQSNMDQRLRTFRSASAQAANIPLEPASTISGLERTLGEAIRAADYVSVDAAQLPRGAAERLAADASELLRHRFGAGSAAGYVQWRREAGYRLRGSEELQTKCLVQEVHRYLFKQELAAGADWDELQAKVLTAMDTHGGGRHRVDKIASDAAGVAVAVKRLTPADPSWPAVGGVVGDLLDAGNLISTHWPWREAPLDPDSLLQANGEALVAQVSLLAQMGDGSVRPMTLSHVWDPAAGRWWHFATHVGNKVGGEPGRTSDAAGVTL